MNIGATHLTAHRYEFLVYLEPHIQRFRPRMSSARRLLSLDIASADARKPYMRARAEVYLPVIGWRGYDPYRGIAVSSGHAAMLARGTCNLASPVADWYSGGSQMETSISLQVDDAG
jgi:transglutaminase-like putative cysteine protease